MPINNGQGIDINISGGTEVDDLIGVPPSWLMRSGITTVAIVFSAILILSHFFKYPDKLTGTATMTALTPPIKLMSRSDGYIESLKVEEGEEIEEGAIIAYIRNTTDQTEIKTMLSWIEKYKQIKNPANYVKLKAPQDLQLGSLQNEYAFILQKYEEMQQQLKNGLVFKQMDNIESEISKIQDLNQLQKNQKTGYAAELDLQGKDFNRHKSLNSDGVISNQELEKAESVLLQKQRQYESFENSIIQNKIKIEQLKMEKLQLLRNRVELINGYRFTLDESINRFQAQVEIWKHTYQIVTPTAGVITLDSKINVNSIVKSGQLLGHILPDKGLDPYMSCNLPVQQIGKIQVGQKALIKLDAFPYKEFGMVVSRVFEISPLPQTDQSGAKSYEVRVELADSIFTDTGKYISYKPETTAVIDIITEDQSILNRIMQRFLNLVKQQS